MQTSESAPSHPQASSASWLTTWAQSIHEMPAPWAVHLLGPGALSIRLPVGGGGSACRITLSNRFGDEPLRVTRVIAAQDGEASFFSFGDQPAVEIHPRAEVTSDPLEVDLPSGGELELSVEFSEPVVLQSINRVESDSWEFRSERPGTAASGRPSFFIGDGEQPSPLPFVARLDVLGHEQNLGILAFGDSLTAGGWPAHLMEDLCKRRRQDGWGVANAGISGSRLLRAGSGPAGSWFGEAGVSRFAKDLAASCGTTEVIALIGVNDILQPGGAAPRDEDVTALEVIDGYRSLIATARAREVRVRFCTLLPFRGAEGATAAREAVREEINTWIRTSSETDGFIDTSAALGDPADLFRLDPKLDSGDHLHPNDAGQRALAAVVSRAVHLDAAES